MAAPPRPGSSAPRPALSLSSFELLHMEMVRYCKAQCRDDVKSAQTKLESMGFQAGRRLAERFSMDKPRFIEALDMIKFLCKEFWIALFNKQVDKLQTNYKGVYVLHDHNFLWIKRISSAELDDTQMRQEAMYYTLYTCGLLRGALDILGLEVTVRADSPEKLPGCQFTIVATPPTQS